MTDKENDTGQDLLGIAPLGRAVERLTDSALSGAEAILSRICLPAAEEFGLLFRDKVSAWRTQNAVKLLQRTETLLAGAGTERVHAPPRLVHAILENASWTDANDVQEMWAGLLASSCTPKGDDDGNLIFVNLLSQLTRMQARLFQFSCETAQKIVHLNGLIGAGSLMCDAARLKEICGTDDIHRIDRELDHLRGLGLIAAGFDIGLAGEPIADLAPSPLGLNLYVRCRGSRQNPIEFFVLSQDKL